MEREETTETPQIGGEAPGIANALISEGATQLAQTLSLIEQRIIITDIQKAGSTSEKYGNFSEEEDALSAVGSNLSEVEEVVVGLQAQHARLLAASSSADPRLALTLSSLLARVKSNKELHAQKVTSMKTRLNLWQSYHKESSELGEFMDSEEAELKSRSSTDADAALEVVEKAQKELEARTAEKAAVVERLGREAAQILPNIEGAEGVVMRERLEELSRRWKLFTGLVAAGRSRVEERQASDSELRENVDEMELWVEETAALVHARHDPSQRLEMEESLAQLEERRREMDKRKTSLESLEVAKNAYVELESVAVERKREVRQALAQLESRFYRLKTELEKRVGELRQRATVAGEFWTKHGELSSFVQSTQTLLDDYHKALIYTPTSLDPNVKAVVRKVLDSQLKEKEGEMGQLEGLYLALKDIAKREYGAEDASVCVETQGKYESLTSSWAGVVASAADVRADIHSSTSSSSEAVGQEKRATSSGSLTPKPDLAVSASSTKSEKDIRVAAQTARDQMQDSADDSIRPMTDSGSTVQVSNNPNMNQLTHLRHWLGDTEREAGGSVELTDVGGIKDAIKTQTAFLDALHTKRLSLIRILEDSRDPAVQHKAEVLSRDWERAVGAAQRRKKLLTQMAIDARNFDSIRDALSIWLQDGNSRTVDGPKVAECTEEELSVQLAGVGLLLDQLEEQKGHMSELNRIGNEMVEKYPDDEHAGLGQTLSDLNTHWTKFNDNIRIRRAVLEASLRSRQDLSTALSELEDWLKRQEIGLNRLDLESDNPALLREPTRRAAWIARSKEVQAEMGAQTAVVGSLEEMGGKVAESLEDPNDAAELRRRIAELSSRWNALGQVHARLRQRLESAQEAWERLTANMKELIYWTETQDKALANQQPIGGDLAIVKAQALFVKNQKKELVEKEPEVKDVVDLAHSFLLQQDLRPTSEPLRQTSVSGGEEDRETRRIAQQIKVEADTLESRWKDLNAKSLRWEKVMEDALGKMYDFDAAIANCETAVGDAEAERRTWRPVKDVQLDHLPQQLAGAKGFRTHLLGLVRNRVDEVNDKGSRLLADNIQLSPDSAKVHQRSKAIRKSGFEVLDALNTRYKQVEAALNARLTGLQNALRHFLVHSVGQPWERSVSANRIPYFINHETEKTQWDHPKMVELAQRLCDFNEVKYSAYRTAMKLRALQKKLCLDLVSLDDLDKVFNRQAMGTASSPERLVDVSEMVMTLLGIFEGAQASYPELVRSLPLAIDLCLNWILNVYDPSRSGALRLLSFKLALVLLSKAHLDEKYRYLFALVTRGADGIDQKKLALLLYDAVQIPKFLGEVAAFGGSNVEPSVRSCFKRNKFPQLISEVQYLDWLLQEPQSLVWMPVLHRIAAAEISKHQAKCNVCKMFPILGLRYRCLKCFNFDVCQNCFFSQRTAKAHKINHPMQEYCIASTSGEDVRDFSKVVRNKFRSKRSISRSSRLGYLPVQSVEEGVPLEARNLTPTNGETEHVHGRVELYATRLAVMDKSQSLSSPGDRLEGDDSFLSFSNHTAEGIASASAGDLGAASPSLPHASVPKSPAQILHQIDTAQKEELDQIMRQLQDENQQLEAEYARLKAGKAAVETEADIRGLSNGHHSLPRLPRGHDHHSLPPPSHPGPRSMTSLAGAGASSMAGSMSEANRSQDDDLLVEARALRLHKQRLEERSRVLEEHNSQLEVQLLRLKQLIQQHQYTNSESGSIELTSMTPELSAQLESASTLAATPLPSGFNTLETRKSGRSSAHSGFTLAAPGTSDETDTSGPDQTGQRIGALMSTAADLGKAMESLVTAVTSDDDLSDRDD